MVCGWSTWHLKEEVLNFQIPPLNVETKFFFLQGKAPKEIHAILTETLGEYAPSYATVKNWAARFKRHDFSTCDAPRPGRPKTVNTPEIIDRISFLVGLKTYQHPLVL